LVFVIISHCIEIDCLQERATLSRAIQRGNGKLWSCSHWVASTVSSTVALLPSHVSTSPILRTKEILFWDVWLDFGLKIGTMEQTRLPKARLKLSHASLVNSWESEFAKISRLHWQTYTYWLPGTLQGKSIQPLELAFEEKCTQHWNAHSKIIIQEGGGMQSKKQEIH
jgi:hypothetical protein